MSLKSSLLFSIAFLISLNIYGQDEMERLYRSNRQNTALDIVQTPDDGYLILSAAREPDSTEFDYYNIIKLSDKGDFTWSKDYKFEEKVTTSGTLHLLQGDSFLVYGTLLNMPKHRFLMKGDPAGNVVWTKGFENSNVDNNTFTFKTPMDISYQNGYIIGGVDVKPLNGTSESWVAELDSEGEFLWAKYYSNPDYENLNITNARSTRDSGLIVSGSISENFNPTDICLIKTDSLGEILWSRKYGDTPVFEVGTAVIQTPDDGYLIGGSIDNNLGVLIKTDTLGLEQWSRNIDFETPNATTFIHEIIMSSDGNVVVAGTLFGTNDNFAFMVKVDLAGNVVWKRKYKASTDDFQNNGLSESSGGGYVFVTTSEENGEQVGPHLIKTSDVGETMSCDTMIMVDLLAPITVTVDTLLNIATSVTFNNVDVTVTDTLNYTIQPPTIVLEQFGPYCPDEMFSEVLDATVPGAIGYEWESGETTPTLVVTEFDTYTVTVTMGEDYCYILCASTAISEKPLPEANITADQGPYCTQGFVNLFANPSNANSLEWSPTMETTPSIQVMNSGTYSVTATNECGEGSNTIDLNIDTTPPDVSISPEGDYCAEGEETLSAVYTEAINSLLWSTGDANNSIVAGQPGSYTVTIFTDFCGDNMASYDLVVPPPPLVSISSAGNYCFDGQETLTASVEGEFVGLEWSTNETTESIVAAQQGSYSVTATFGFCEPNSATFEVTGTPPNVSIGSDGVYCDDGEQLLYIIADPIAGLEWSTGEVTDTISVTGPGDYSVTVTTGFCENVAEINVPCILQLGMPNVFTPNGDEENDIFRPFYNVQPRDFESYRFCVYSRWGEKVFETTDPDQGWDGTFKDELAVSDVYIWTLEGRTRFGGEIDEKDRSGDVTLLR